MRVKNMARRRAICRFIRQFIEEHGYCPSAREVGRSQGIKSGGHIEDFLGRMEDEGLVTRDFYVQRSLRLTAKGEALAREEEPDAPPAA